VPLGADSYPGASDFLGLRRAVPSAVVALFEEQPNVPPPAKPAEPEHSPLALIGAVLGDSGAIAIFLDRSSQKIVRLRQGDTHGGWELSRGSGGPRAAGANLDRCWFRRYAEERQVRRALILVGPSRSRCRHIEFPAGPR
jgi:hypothetical protein